MPIAYVLQATVACQATSAVVEVRYTKAASSTGTENSAKTWTLDGPGGYHQQLPSPGINSPVQFTVYLDGSYTLSLDSDQPWGDIPVDVSCGITTPPALQLQSVVPTGATATGGGSIRAVLIGGVAPLLQTVVEAALTQAAPAGQAVDFVNLPPRTYAVRGTDSAGQRVEQNVVVAAYVPTPRMGCTDPAATNYDPQATQDDGSCAYTPVARQPYFQVPLMQSLRFVRPGAGLLDDTLLADEHPLDYENPGYCQKVESGDTLTVQVLSNYANAPVVKLCPAGSATAVRSVTATRVQQGAGTTAAFEVYVKPDPALAGRVRVYFNDDTLPLPFFPGNRVTLGNTGTGLDGTYPVQQVLEDATAGAPYLLLVATYSSGSPRVDAELSTTYVVQAYDTWQAALSFAGLAQGCYQAQVMATDADFADALAVSEPIDLAPAWPDAVLVSYRNFDNAFGLNYSHGLMNRLRVTGRFFERKPQTEKVVLRNDNNELELLSGSAYRKVHLETLLLPGWLHEQLAVAFCHDAVKLNGLPVTVEGEYTYTATDRYTLGKGEALAEARQFLGAGNRDDVGGVDAGGGPFLLANQTFLLARK